MRNLVTLLLSILICELAGIIGSVFTAPNIPTWYQGIAKPTFTPPDWVFAPVWIILYGIMGISLYLVLIKKRESLNKNLALLYFGLQLVFNIIWSYIFFELHFILGGFITIILLFILILITATRFYYINKLAGLLLIPYLMWVSFAGILNYFILILN